MQPLTTVEQQEVLEQQDMAAHAVVQPAVVAQQDCVSQPVVQLAGAQVLAQWLTGWQWLTG